MIPALILSVALLAALQFFISYVRSILATYSKVELSEQTRDVAGLSEGSIGGEDFPRLLQLVRLCPEPGDDSTEIRSVRLYYRMLGGLRSLARKMAPAMGQWAERERGLCAYFAAVALDRRIAYNRDLMAEQATHQ